MKVNRTQVEVFHEVESLGQLIEVKATCWVTLVGYDRHTGYPAHSEVWDMVFDYACDEPYASVVKAALEDDRLIDELCARAEELAAEVAE